MAAPSSIATPLNRTARAAHIVVGNPVVTRPEDAVANCFPGLEIDVRNFDRRFFPGLVFEFISGTLNSQPNDVGARLAYVDADQDPDMTTELYAALTQGVGTSLQHGIWFIEAIMQHHKSLVTRATPDDDGNAAPFDGLVVWRLVRSLLLEDVTVTLLRRDIAGGPTVTLTALRRRFTDEGTGVISTAFQPGELLQSLCSPWQHDFRDCYCNYWAANHPDLVFAEIPKDGVLPGGLAKDPVAANVRLDWLRAERSPHLSAAAQGSNELNRPYQYDHYQINSAWEELPFVLNDTEQGNYNRPTPVGSITTFATPQLLVIELRDRLAPLEVTLALEYLYARDSLLTPKEIAGTSLATKWPLLADHVSFARQALLLTAVSEMQHLRIVNELLWRLYKKGDALGLCGAFVPVLTPMECVPTGRMAGQTRPAALRLLTPDVLQAYIDVESPSATIDGAYGRVAKTLQDPTYGSDLLPLAERIAAEGMEHFARFSYIRTVFDPYICAGSPYPYLRNDLIKGNPNAINDPHAADVAVAIASFAEIQNALKAGYGEAAEGNLSGLGGCVVQARAAMTSLLAKSQALARNNRGVPYF